MTHCVSCSSVNPALRDTLPSILLQTFVSAQQSLLLRNTVSSSQNSSMLSSYLGQTDFIDNLASFLSYRVFLLPPPVFDVSFQLFYSKLAWTIYKEHCTSNLVERQVNKNTPQAGLISCTIKSELPASSTTHTNSLTAGAPPNQVPIRTALLQTHTHYPHCMQYTIDCVQYTVHCVQYNVHWLLNTANTTKRKLSNAQYTLHIRFCTMRTVHWKLHSRNC